MADEIPTKPKRKNIRLKGYDYTLSGAYFITMVTWQREFLFGELMNEVMQINSIGDLLVKFAITFWIIPADGAKILRIQTTGSDRRPAKPNVSLQTIKRDHCSIIRMNFHDLIHQFQ